MSEEPLKPEHEAPAASADALRASVGRVVAAVRGLDPSAAMDRGKSLAGHMPGRPRFSSLTIRILVCNVAALLILVAGILFLTDFRSGLIEARTESLLTQAEIIAGAIAENATRTPGTRTIDPGSAVRVMPRAPGTAEPAGIGPIMPENAAPILRRLALPTGTRARLYGADGNVLLDSRELTMSGSVTSFYLPPPPEQSGSEWINTLYRGLVALLPGRNLPLYKEGDNASGFVFEEVGYALRGTPQARERVSERGELIVSVAVPVQRFKVVVGALMLTTEGGDIDAVVRSERLVIFQVFLVALGVTVLLSIVLAGTIAEPIRRLARAAYRVRSGRTGRVAIPKMGGRADEIGELAVALDEMTTALYNRIDAIERFAADVAHELKNPLTSLRSAVETLAIARDQDRPKLAKIIEHDVRRLDRLISDISDASRLDAELGRAEMSDVEVATLLETVVGLYRDRTGEDAVSVRLDIDAGPAGPEALIVRGFDSRLGQVVQNLVDNAISFSPPGGEVRVVARTRPGRVIIAVEDGGPGIRPEQLARVFERFYTDRPPEEEFGRHSGLGLSIVRQIVEAHGGTIHAENREEPAHGARFVVDLPQG